MREDAGRGWRRVVPSPEPREIVELEAVRDLVAAGCLVVCAGGGGVPVVRSRGALSGIDAVIDKDLAAALLARELGADALLILTDVPRAYVALRHPRADGPGHGHRQPDARLRRRRPLQGRLHGPQGRGLPALRRRRRRSRDRQPHRGRPGAGRRARARTSCRTRRRGRRPRPRAPGPPPASPAPGARPLQRIPTRPEDPSHEPAAGHRGHAPRRTDERGGQAGRAHPLQAGGLQPGRLGQGPPGAQHDRQGRGARRPHAGRGHPGADLGQHRHRHRHDRRRQGLPPCACACRSA